MNSLALSQELIKQKEELEGEERETTERVWKTRRAILDKVNQKPVLNCNCLLVWRARRSCLAKHFTANQVDSLIVLTKAC